MVSMIRLPQIAFGATDIERAHEAWYCNCGPAALAAALGKTLDEIKPAVLAVGFGTRRYMNPTMMAKAIKLAGGSIAESLRPTVIQDGRSVSVLPRLGIVRIQWTGPWTTWTTNARWAYRATHWIATCRVDRGDRQEWLVFDVNGGLWNYNEWKSQVVPFITSQLKRADGGWYATHSWSIEHAQS